MKLLLVLVSIVVVFTVDGRDFHKEPEGGNTVAGEAQLFPDGTKSNGKILVLQDGTDGHNSGEETQNLPLGNDNQDSAEQVYKLKVQIGQHERKLKRSRCKARNACVVMGGFCVTNATLCSGRLVPEGCKGMNCQCCVPGTIEAKFHTLEEELQSIKENMNNTNTNLNTELQSLKDNVNNSYSELQYIKENVNTGLTNVNSKLESLAKNPGCPKGFSRMSSSDQCFRFFNDKSRTWTAAKSKCAAEGGVLAKPYDPLGLRNYLVMRYGNPTNWPWLGARGTGSTVKWDRDGTDLSKNNPMWYTGHPSGKTSTSYCLQFAVQESWRKNHPNTPYYMTDCTGTRYSLCELIME